MFMKSLGLFLPVAIGGYYLTGGFSGGYTRDVGRPQAEVMAALADLDIREQPGAPGTDPSRSGGVTPLFKEETKANAMTWTVMSGDKVATSMTAQFQPIDGGKGTRVTARVARGDAPDDFVSPAFRSKGLTMGLFAMALDSELDELTAPPPGSAATCAALQDRFQAANISAGGDRRPEGLGAAMGNTATTVMRLSAFEAEAHRLGCDRRSDAFEAPVARMGAAPPPMRSADGTVSFEPGKPMIDLSHRR